MPSKLMFTVPALSVENKMPDAVTKLGYVKLTVLSVPVGSPVICVGPSPEVKDPAMLSSVNGSVVDEESAVPLPVAAKPVDEIVNVNEAACAALTEAARASPATTDNNVFLDTGRPFKLQL